MTQNYMCENVSCFLTDNVFKELAKNFSSMENSGLLNQYFDEARLLCKKHNVKVCDVRKSWLAMHNAGVNITELLANKLNHPIREIHDYMAIKLVETIMDL